MSNSQLSPGVIASCDGLETCPGGYSCPSPSTQTPAQPLAFSDKYILNQADARVVQPPATLIGSRRLLDLLLPHVQADSIEEDFLFHHDTVQSTVFLFTLTLAASTHTHTHTPFMP